MQLFGHLLTLVILDMAGFERHLEAAAGQLHLPTEPIRHYLAAIRGGARPSFVSLPEALRAWWSALSQSDRRPFVEGFRTPGCQHPYASVEGSLETIHWFRRQRIPVTLCTTNDRPMLASRFRSAHVDLPWFAVASTRESGQPKPDPRALDSIFTAIPVPREQTVYVGDWYPDVDTARGGWVRCIAALSGGLPRHAFLREGVPEAYSLARPQDLPGLMQPLEA
jgi:phosphoglycolate phosphatase-like HAD superfamily hydrolase